jgi:hypothetical protein
LTKRQRFEIWAPPAVPWSAWAKPILFAHAPTADPPEPLLLPPPEVTSWAPPADGHWAVVVDLPGAVGLLTGVSLAAVGYRPVPLYNASPGFASTWTFRWPRVLETVVPVEPILRAIITLTPVIKEMRLPYAAPPAFLLDSARRGPPGSQHPGQFDNRSISFPTDFPSANVLLSHGIVRVLLVQRGGHEPQADLTHTLRRWQEAGVEIWCKDVEAAEPARPITVRVPAGFRLLWYNLTARLGLRRSPLGGFGGVVPEPNAGGGG